MRPDPRIAAGALALAAIGVLIGGALIGLVVEGARDTSGALSAFDPYLRRVVLFTLWQAGLSTLFSVLPAILLARAIARHPRFFGRGLILRLFAVPLALPAIVAALGVLALYGRAGYFADLLSTLSGSRWPGIYGLSGILVAHVFFNLPLATRLLLEALATVPADQQRLGAQLGFGAVSSFRFVEWPALRASLPAVAGLVFMLCITSFTIVLILGGGPRATTLEVAIYQALRFDFDPARAVTLTGLQIGLTVATVLLLGRLGADIVPEANLSVASRSHAMPGTAETFANAATIALGVAFVCGPMAAIVLSGLEADLARLVREPAVHRATLTSLALSAGAALLSLALSLALIRARHALAVQRGGRRPSFFERMTDTGASLVLVVPPIVVGAGWFILVRHFADVFALAPVMVVTVNAVMAMPFVLRALRPAHDAAAGRHDRLCQQLGLVGWNRLRLVDWPSWRRPLLVGFAFASALSLGDLGVIALFGSDAVQTLPYLLYSRMASYRTADAAGIALFLGVLCLTLMMLADRAGREAR